MKFLRKTGLVVALLAGLSGPAFSTTYYQQSVNNQTSVTITNATHGIGGSPIAVRVYNNSGVRQPTSTYSVSVNGSYDVTVSWGSSFTGTVKLSGFYTSDTNNENDFKPTLGTSSPPYGNIDQFRVCYGCGDSVHESVRTASRKYIMWGNGVYQHTTGACTLRVYIEDNRLKFGLSAGSGSCSGAIVEGSGQVENNVSSFPSGSVKIGEASTASSGNKLYGLSDLRPWLE